jgi:hypothetical protein
VRKLKPTPAADRAIQTVTLERMRKTMDILQSNLKAQQAAEKEKKVKFARIIRNIVFVSHTL